MLPESVASTLKNPAHYLKIILNLRTRYVIILIIIRCNKQAMQHRRIFFAYLVSAINMSYFNRIFRSTIYILLICLLCAMAQAQPANTYRFVYKVSYPDFKAGSPLNNWVLQQVVKSARYRCLADRNGCLLEFQLQRTKADELANKDADTIVDMNIRFHSSDAKKTYRGRDIIKWVLDDNERNIRCAQLQQEPLINTGITRRIAGRLCGKWITAKPAYQSIELWVCTDIAKEINPGFGIGLLPGGVVYVNIAGKQYYTLAEMGKTTDRMPAFPCREIHGKYNIYDYMVNKLK